MFVRSAAQLFMACALTAAPACSDTGGSLGGAGGVSLGGGGAGAQQAEGGGGSPEGGGAEGGVAWVPFGLNDVSVLFPLPETVDSEAALRLDAEGVGGPLLSAERYAIVTDLAQGAAVDYGAWIVVSARIDPCFPDLAYLASAPAQCRRQLRLVAQPFMLAPDTMMLGAADHALHLLYDLSVTEFDALLADWFEAKPSALSDPSERLGVNPTLAAEGLGGPYATRLREVILRYAGAGSLSQLTFMRSRGTAWDFGGFRLEQGALTPLTIPGLPAPGERVVFGNAGEAEPFTVAPTSPQSSVLLALAGESVAGVLTLTASYNDRRAAFELSRDLDDPTRFNADTTDCASCHFAARARQRAVALGDDFGYDGYQSDVFDLTVTVPAEEQANPRQLRGFGWIGTEPMLMPRTVNESAAVAEWLGERVMLER